LCGVEQVIGFDWAKTFDELSNKERIISADFISIIGDRDIATTGMGWKVCMWILNATNAAAFKHIIGMYPLPDYS
jgi:hypothetical protein